MIVTECHLSKVVSTDLRSKPRAPRQAFLFLCAQRLSSDELAMDHSEVGDTDFTITVQGAMKLLMIINNK